MADERFGTSRPSWKRKARPSPRPDGAAYKWPERQPTPPKPRRSWNYKVVGAFVAFTAFLAFVVVLIVLIRPPQPAAVILVGANYATNLTVPHNVPGWEGLMGIEAVSKTPRPWALFNPASLQLIRGRRILDRADQWDDLIDDLRKKGFTEKVILIVLALHGGSDSKGAYLLPNRMSRPEDRLDLKHVIESMGRLPTDKPKILVLEGAQIPADWRLGMLHNDFARRLKDLEPEIRKVKGLWVLSGCDVDQRCWASEGLGRTVFTHYIIEALRGKAAGSDECLTLEELYQYVRRNVRNWVWNARGAVQEPVLLPRTNAREEGAADASDRPSPRAVFLASHEGASASTRAAVPDRAELTRAWQRFHRLNRLVPHPSVYSPRRWREYRAVLVRYEELVRTGETEQARTMTERLGMLERILRNERFLKMLPDSAENNLVMNAVQGGAAEIISTSSPELIRLWNVPTKVEAIKEWESLQSGAAAVSGDDDLRPSLRSRAADFLLQLAAKDPVAHLKRAADQLELIKGSDYPQPAEAHFLRMLSIYLPSLSDRPPSYWTVVTDSLALRRQAERAALGLSEQLGAYHYCEQVHPWIRPLVEQADAQRRLGEDQLFSSEAQTWDQSKESLDQASEYYQQALQRASMILEALATRDRVLSVLPDYSRWLPHRPADELQDDLLQTVENLWKTTHELTEALEDAPGAAPGLIDQLAKAIAAGFERVSRQFTDQRSRIDSTRLKEDWEAATAAAAVAFADSDDLALRTTIWDRLDNIRKNDFEVADKGEMAVTSADEQKQALQRIQRRAHIEGLMSLAVLGQRWFNDPMFQDQDQVDFQKATERIQRPISEEENQTWWKDLATAGELIGRRWRQFAVEIDRLASEENGISDFRAFQSRLVKADRLSRLIDGGAAPLDESVGEATARYRQTRIYDLLLWMAERTWQDHWYDEEPKAKPYYKVAGSRYVTDAAKLFPNTAEVLKIKNLLDQSDQFQLDLTKPSQLPLDVPPRLVLTSERGLAVSYRVVESGAIPPGLPVVKPRVDRLLQLDDDATGYRIARRTSGETIDFTLFSPLLRQAESNPTLIRPRVEQTTLSVEGLFRGQPFGCRTEVELHPLPEVVAIGPAAPDPPLASIAVRADQQVIDRFGEGNGAIAIVLDCSGSMIPGETNSLAEANALPSKFRDAKNALARVLKQVPQGTTVSIWVFGQARAGFTSLNQRQPIDDVQGQEPEQTIRQLLPPTTWNPAQLDNLIKQLDQLWPLYGTPLVQAMRNAKRDLDKAKGLKTLLVLTDGDDNRFMVNNRFNGRGIAIPQFIQAFFNNTGITINMIFFRVSPKELEKALENFRGVIALNPPGHCFTVEKFADLVVTLEQSIRQKLACQIIRQPDGTPVSDELLDVTNPDEADRWWTSGLEPSTYKLRVRADRIYEQEIDLARGDRLIVRLVEGPDGGLVFERALYSDEIRENVHQDRAGWRLSVLANRCQDEQGKAFQMLTALEALETRSHRLRHVKPRLTWFELRPRDTRGEPEFAVRWRERMTYPAPTWQIDVPQWVADPAGAGAPSRS